MTTIIDTASPLSDVPLPARPTPPEGLPLTPHSLLPFTPGVVPRGWLRAPTDAEVAWSVAQDAYDRWVYTEVLHRKGEPNRSNQYSGTGRAIFSMPGLKFERLVPDEDTTP